MTKEQVIEHNKEVYRMELEKVAHSLNELETELSPREWRTLKENIVRKFDADLKGNTVL